MFWFEGKTDDRDDFLRANSLRFKCFYGLWFIVEGFGLGGKCANKIDSVSGLRF